MANNRMFLIHVPTGLGIPLAKCFGWGSWSLGHPDNEKEMGSKLERLFEVLLSEYFYAEEQNNFAVVMEDAEGAPFAIEGCASYTERDDGLVQLDISDHAKARGEDK